MLVFVNIKDKIFIESSFSVYEIAVTMLKSNASTINKNQIGIPRKTLNPKIWPFSGDQSKNDIHGNVISPLELIPGGPKLTKAFLPANEIIIRQNPPENGVKRFYY